MYVASTFRRIIAHVMDESFGAIFWIPLAVNVWGQVGRGHNLVVPWPLIGYAVVARIAYEIICIYVLQALPAQYFLGLKIMSTYHPELGLGLMQVAIRVIFSQLKYVVGPSIYFMALFHRDRQHIGDILAETRVVQVQERFLGPKPHAILASILVFSSLVINLNEVVERIADNHISSQGIKIELPKFDIKFQGAGI
jgi:uncharacterized RDD family membrane protein YckC